MNSSFTLNKNRSVPIISVFHMPEVLDATAENVISGTLARVYVWSIFSVWTHSLIIIASYVDKAKEFSGLHWNPNVSFLGRVKPFGWESIQASWKNPEETVVFEQIRTFKENVHCKANLKNAEVLWWNVHLGLSHPTTALLLDNVMPWLFQTHIFQVSQVFPGVF